jgi:hypothetical protein
MNAWLLTWEGTGSRVVSDNKILAIISSRRSSSFIKDLVDVLYCRSVDSAYDMATRANKRKQRDRELMATFSTPSRIFYGRNPMIFARLVTALKVVRNEAQGTETVSWTDPPYLKIEKPGELPVVTDPERYCEVVRQINVPLSRDLYYKDFPKTPLRQKS